jgi:hypothetical protein
MRSQDEIVDPDRTVLLYIVASLDYLLAGVC